MLTRPTEKEILALARIVLSDDGKLLKEYLVRSLTAVTEKMVAADADTLIRRLQGRAEALNELREALDISPDLVTKLEHRARGR